MAAFIEVGGRCRSRVFAENNIVNSVRLLEAMHADVPKTPRPARRCTARRSAADSREDPPV
jgi:hypothetical protein